jgi:hypothetical protein
MPSRTLSLKPLTDVSEIWNEAERRLKTDRSNFSLVYEGSHYLPREGILPKPTQLFEIRWQGRGGKPKEFPENADISKDPRAGFLPEMVKVQYKLEKDGKIWDLWMPLNSEIGQVKRELIRRHPDIQIQPLYQGGAMLDDTDAVSDWRSRTGSRFQATISVEIEIREEHEHLDFEPECSTSDEANQITSTSLEETGEKDEEEGAIEEEESSKDEDNSSMHGIRKTIVADWIPDTSAPPSDPPRVTEETPKLMTIFGRWGMIRVPNQGDWRELVKRTLYLKSGTWEPREWTEGEFQVLEEIKKIQPPEDEEEVNEEDLNEADGSPRLRKSCTPCQG